uniref:Uncharacterized protein n=1 Tax=Magallana gigas TaxID=29159 RepID=A0A8W8JC16_MAGGI
MSRRTINLGISIIYHLMCFLEADPCFSILSNGQCCEHYMRIRNTNACKPCPDGYTGDSCHITCPAPSYGPGCQQQCHTCSVTSCHHVHGCSIHTSTFTKKMEVLEAAEKHLASYILKENASKEKENWKPKAFRHTGSSPSLDI